MKLILKYCFGLPAVAFERGSVLITEGKGRGPLFVLVSGSVDVLRGGIKVARIETPGAIFGEMSALLDMPHTATVQAVSDVRVHMIENTNQFIQSRPEIGVQVACLLARRLLDATTLFVDATRNYADRDSRLGKIVDTVEAIIHGGRDAPADEA